MNILGKILSYCGINCGECPAYLATQRNDVEEIKKISKEWSSGAMKFTPEEIYCDGCCKDSRHFSWVDKCDIKMCCTGKKLENCAYCDDYICDLLKNSFEKDPNAKQNLEEIRKFM